MKQLVTIILTLLQAAAQAQNWKSEISIGFVDSIHSAVLNEERGIFVYIPRSYADSASGKHKYPVVYLLDGDIHFVSVAGMVEYLSEGWENTLIPEMIVVGITNTNRMRDFTPTQSSYSPWACGCEIPRSSGGAEDFTRFLEKELIPHIDSFYPSAPYKILIGHSLGGLLVINTLLHHTDMFNAYIAEDPSMWWDHQILEAEAITETRLGQFKNRSLYLSVANTLLGSTDTARLKTDTSRFTIHMRTLFQLRDALVTNTANGLRFGWKFYREEDHGAVPFISEYEGLKYILSDYWMPDYEIPYQDKSFDPDSAIDAHFRKISRNMGYTVRPGLTQVDNIASNYLLLGKYDKAYLLYSKNVRNYPRSAAVYVSLGDYYVSAGDKQNGIKNYAKALSLKYDAITKEKLDRLKPAK